MTTNNCTDKQLRDLEYGRNKEQINRRKEELAHQVLDAGIKSRNSFRKQLMQMIQLDLAKDDPQVRATIEEEKPRMLKALVASIKRPADEEEEIVDIVKAEAAFNFYNEFTRRYYDKYESTQQAVQNAAAQTLVETIAQTTDADK
jgi:hypothetical protein